MHRLARPLLNLAICAGLILAAWPVGQTLYGVWNQRSLAAQWRASSGGAEERRSGGDGENKAKTPKKSAKAKSLSSAPLLLRSSAEISSAPLLLRSSAEISSAPLLLRSSAEISSAPLLEAKRPWSLTRLSIPDINLETFVVQGIGETALKRGPGHDPNSALPGTGNCVVAGHRNIYGSFFYRLDELLPGALITLENRDGKFDYIVNSVSVTPDTNLTVLQPPPAGAAPILTLITCTLPHSNNRIILQASLSSE